MVAGGEMWYKGQKEDFQGDDKLGVGSMGKFTCQNTSKHMPEFYPFH